MAEQSVPHAAARRIVIELIYDLLENTHRNYYASLSFAEAVATQVICGQIILANIIGKTITSQQIAKRVQVGRRTIDRRITVLINAGFLKRAGRGLRFKGDMYHDASIEEAMKLIITAANKLSPMVKKAMAKTTMAKTTTRVNP